LQPREYTGHLGLFLDFAPEVGVRDIPDPYRGSMSDFERVVDFAERGAPPLLAVIRENLAQTK